MLMIGTSLLCALMGMQSRREKWCVVGRGRDDGGEERRGEIETKLP